MGISSPIFINDSLCAYYEKFRTKCRKLRNKKYVHGFWVWYGLIKIKVSESSLPNTIPHDVALVKKLQKIQKDNSED